MIQVLRLLEAICLYMVSIVELWLRCGGAMVAQVVALWWGYGWVVLA